MLNQLAHGKIHPRKNIEEFKDKLIYFEDGIKEEYDAVIVATGYNISFPFLKYEEFDFKDKIVDLYLKMYQPKFPNLAIIGLIQPQGCIWPLSDTQAQIMANYIAGNYKWPKDINKKIEKEVNTIKKNFINTPRHSTEVEYHSFQKKLFKEVPKSAPKWIT